jgi:ribosomal-protein-alanine N-acetyltransferase
MADLTQELTRDAEALAALHSTSFPDKPWSAAEIQALIDGGAFALSEPGGFILARVAADEAEILTLAVEPQRRRQGIGLALIRAACHAAEERGANMIFLEVAIDNEAALAVYRRARFEPVAVRPHYYTRADGTAVDAQVLERLLNRGEP